MSHRATRDVIAVVEAVTSLGSLASTSQIATTADVSRDSARRILRELADSRWVDPFDVDGVEMWRLGGALPRIGLAHQRALVAEQEALCRRFDALRASSSPNHAAGVDE